MNMKIYALNPLPTAVNPTSRGKSKNMMRSQLNSQKQLVALSSVSSRRPWRLCFLLTGVALTSLALAPSARSACREGCDAFLENAFLGDDALVNNTTGQFNTAIGFEALFSNTTGQDNTATGTFALFPNTTGSGNTADGSGALGSNSSGTNNTAIGTKALNSATIANENTAIGVSALRSDSTGANNTAVGTNAFFNSTTGSGNTAVGHFAGINLATGSNNIYINNDGVASESNKIRIGTKGIQQATFIAGISGKAVSGGVGVMIDTNGKLGTVISSERFKDAIKPMDKTSEAILSLQPVTFRYKKELDPAGIAQFGLVAEQVEKINPDLVARDEEGKPYTVRYEAVNAMLLNEFLKEHRKVAEQGALLGKQSRQLEEQQGTISEFKSALAQQQKEIKALSAGLQKVSNKLELTKPAARVVANN
jgi:hypothetical protein